MKINDKLKLRKMAGENIVILPSKDAQDMTKVLSMNETSIFLWNELSGKDFTVEDVIKALTENYEVDEARAREDALKWIDNLKSINVIQ